MWTVMYHLIVVSCTAMVPVYEIKTNVETGVGYMALVRALACMTITTIKSDATAIINQ